MTYDGGDKSEYRGHALQCVEDVVSWSTLSMSGFVGSCAYSVCTVCKKCLDYFTKYLIVVGK